MRPRIAVIGGGIAGLSAAHALAERAASVEVVLLEASNRLGGVLETTRCDGFLIEAAADNFLTSPPGAVDLCRRLGLEDALVGTDPARRQAFVVRHGRLQSIPAGFQIMAPSRFRPMLTSPVLSVLGKLRVGLELFLPPSRSDEDQPLASFVRRRFGREMFDRLVQPLVGGIFAADAERLSVDATMPRFREMERQHGSVIRAALRQQRQQPQERSSGARYGQFAALRYGMSSLIDGIASRLPEQSVRLAAPVHRIVPRECNRWLLSIGGDHPHSLEVDGVVLATPAHRSAIILAELDNLLAKNLADIEYSSCAVVSLGYRRDQIGHALDGFGFVVPLAEQRTILSCSFSSVKYEGRAPNDFVLLRVVIGGACQGGLLRLSAEQLVGLAEREVADLLHIQGKPVLRYHKRQVRALPQYHVGHRDRVAGIHNRLARFPTLALAGSAYGGVGVPACIQSGQVAAEQILSQLDATARCSKIAI
jgi:oxygen-dependent protoporphyrinogen oxidase